MMISKTSILITLFCVAPILIVPISFGDPANPEKNFSADSKIWRFDFGTEESPEGYIPLDQQTLYDQDKGYGWTTPPQQIRDRSKPDSLLKDFVYSNTPAVFRISLVPGYYRIKATMGDQEFGNHVLQITIPQSHIDFPLVHSRAGEFAEISAAFEIKENLLDLYFDSPQQNWVLNSLILEPVNASEVPRIKKKTYEPINTWEDVSSWPDPIDPYLNKYLNHLARAQRCKPTGLSRKDYLRVIAGVVDFFKDYQDEQGAIIDPYRKVEYQYSTPCFALAAATLVVHANRTDLGEPAFKAMDWATWTLSQGNAASHHEDFFSPQIAHALPLLKPLVDPQRYAQWEENIKIFDPYTVYRARPGGGNWNVVALSGEALYYRMGLRNSPDFIENSIAAQGRFFNCPWGLYTEGPMPYDHFPRIWAADMLASGYTGKNTEQLREVLRRGALTSLFMQSPVGELPAGGRSAHHQWNEAEQCLTYEIYAKPAKDKGDLLMAGVYKRAAHLALQSITRWIRPSGELWIVKNRVDPSQFHGYEGYSSHSQYNLLAMAMLAIAYEHAGGTEEIDERLTPADLGGFVIQLPHPFNKVFANAGGMYLEIDYNADLNYNATGLIRVHKKGFNPQLGPSDALTSKALYHLPEKPEVTAAIGAAWKKRDGTWISLAQFGRSKHQAEFDLGPRVTLSQVKERPDKVSFQLIYEQNFEGPSKVIENYVVTPDWIDLEVELKDYSGPMRLVWPVLANDGERAAEIKIQDSTINVSLEKQTQSYKAYSADSVRVEKENQGFRNGWARLAVAEYSNAGKAKLRIQPLKQR